MAFLFRIFMALCIVLLMFDLARAQDNSPLPKPSAFYDYAAGPLYMNMARQALNERPADFDFGKFRALYTQSPAYDPAGDVTRNFLLDKAYYIRGEKDESKRRAMLDRYADMVITHLANIDIVNQALALSRDDPRFGDPSFYEWMRGGLLSSVLNSGNGDNLFNAYVIVAMGEETLLLNALGVRVLKTVSRESAGTYYNIHDVQAYDTGEKRSIFTNISIPMRFLDQQHKTTRVYAVEIRRQ